MNRLPCCPGAGDEQYWCDDKLRIILQAPRLGICAGRYIRAPKCVTGGKREREMARIMGIDGLECGLPSRIWWIAT